MTPQQVSLRTSDRQEAQRLVAAKNEATNNSELTLALGKTYLAVIDPGSLTPFWRITISLNDEPESLLTLPPLDNSLEDKVILCKAAKHPMPMPASSLRERDLFGQTLKGELPAFIDFLLGREIPGHLKSERFGITHYHHPDVRKAIDTLAPEMRLLEIIDAAIFTYRKEDWTGTAADLENELARSVTKAREARALSDFPTAAGTYLGRLGLFTSMTSG